MTSSWVADVVYLAIKPVELLARLAVRNIPDPEIIPRPYPGILNQSDSCLSNPK